MTRYYPGSRTPIKTFDKPTTSTIEEDDLGNSRTFLVNGEPREFYKVGSLAQALNRQPGTIRKWENEGVIPSPTFVLPSADKRGVRRLYTKEQILGLRQAALEEGLLEPNANGKWKAVEATEFKQKALQLFKNLEGS